MRRCRRNALPQNENGSRNRPRHRPRSSSRPDFRSSGSATLTVPDTISAFRRFQGIVSPRMSQNVYGCRERSLAVTETQRRFLIVQTVSRLGMPWSGSM
jgi:hypothetical protein